MMTYFKNMYIKAEFKKEIQLIIDVETRWNSLHFMLGRFDKLRHCVMKSLIDLKSNIVFDEIEMNSINDLITILEPVTLAVEAICHRDATLITASTTITFMLNNLGNSDLAKRMKQSLANYLNKRRTCLSSLLQYLHKGNQDTVDCDHLLNATKLTKNIITNMIAELTKTNEDSISSETETDGEDDLVQAELSLQGKLQQANAKERNFSITSKVKSTRSVLTIIKKEMAFHQPVSNKKGFFLVAVDWLRKLDLYWVIIR